MSVYRKVSLSTSGLLQGLTFIIPIGYNDTSSETIKVFKSMGCNFLRTIGMEYASAELHKLEVYYHGPSMVDVEPNDVIWVCSHCR